ncbi:MAG TPA: type IV pili methyl-accepting chemotaxis transducer N-terminal domain-containing protein, partial [Plasticicumulans sp.]|nr:type IV pili methyl-accepting chemotaxis transducer N-terminal domain-containing protein [Plasticicumulans sp.]
MTLPPLPPLRDSLLWRMGLLLGGIALLALIGMSNALLTAVASAGDAAAINIAGSLRMQSYRIATRLGAA